MAQKILFIDRDGTIIQEPEDEQIDSLEKLSFVPGAITYLRKIAEQTDYLFVMVTNQDGLGTSSFPEDTFWPAHQKMLSILEGEGITFHEILIDRSFPQDNAPTRKPRTGLLTEYMHGTYDLNNSYVIGDRTSDIELAKNLGSKAIYLSEKTNDHADLTTTDWQKIYQHLVLSKRAVTHHRNTKETKITVEINLDGNGQTNMDTGLGFFDHMLDQLGKHSGMDLAIKVQGDLHIDEHHTIEDTALALGEAFIKALGTKRGIQRYGFLLPMDDALAQVAIDLGGRPWLVWDATFNREKVGDMPTEMFYHFFKSFSDAAKCNLNIQVQGDNEHHKIEAIFKGLAKAIKMAIQRDESRLDSLPSTKGTL
uniref:Histidine biosynthesis bifunctional protein HisB n=1 Tax=Roseihalotalea indica TaxID=2867963 RepID=A0AA49GKG4_9BACT|nr:bifunctional histidinol-phosphatase/imidazoleglycerol-phosphate dehydratase HisB [Tunicatimonas sp. TK19036]